jgi:hypothetical protein
VHYCIDSVSRLYGCQIYKQPNVLYIFNGLRYWQEDAVISILEPHLLQELNRSYLQINKTSTLPFLVLDLTTFWLCYEYFLILSTKTTILYHLLKMVFKIHTALFWYMFVFFKDLGETLNITVTLLQYTFLRLYL